MYVHKRGLVHRDIASRNFLLNKHLTTYLCDFGLSVWQDENGNVVLTPEPKKCAIPIGRFKYISELAALEYTVS